MPNPKGRSLTGLLGSCVRNLHLFVTLQPLSRPVPMGGGNGQFRALQAKHNGCETAKPQSR